MSYTSINPYTEETLKTFPDATATDIKVILNKGHEAFLKWRKTSFAERSKILHKAASLLKENLNDYTALMADEVGKLLHEGEWEITLCANICDYYADHAEEILKPQKIKKLTENEGDSVLYPTPQGIIWAIEPWNVPFFQVFRILAPQIAGGNVVLLKHAPCVPQCAEMIVKLMREAGLPEGVFQNIYSTNEQTEEILKDQRIRGVALTGSTKAGSIVAGIASKYIKKSTLELGGADAFIVLEDASLEKAVQTAVFARHFNAGQICISPKRMIIMDEIYDEFLTRYKAAVKSLKAGDPKDQTTTLGPLVSKAALEHLNQQVEEAKKQGVTVETIGAPVPKKGYFFQPILMTGLEGKEIRKEEFFGPVTHLYRVKTDQEAIDLANESEYGLSGSIQTGDEKRGIEIAKKIDSGSFSVNGALFTSPNAPFGGVKNSGYGRDLAHDGILEFMNMKLINIQK
ncbi:NAD-dependent succinate-semialdehyde dehydrogenase [Acetobacteraceae bacterium]|nr:NAD-dependent succinate-semialdehyde dehydrogenase [Acetobacteraceae bacterium]